MTNETTYLENLLNKRKVVRNYKKTTLKNINLKNISKYSIKMENLHHANSMLSKKD